LDTSRLDQLSEIVRRNPGNLLAFYGLAMEYAQQGDHSKALETFRALMASNPNYVAAYYQAGRELQKIGEVQQARDVFQQGIAASNRVGDLHARSELEAALGELSD
jgi:Tfp pilus assembly protein PilF